MNLLSTPIGTLKKLKIRILIPFFLQKKNKNLWPKLNLVLKQEREKTVCFNSLCERNTDLLLCREKATIFPVSRDALYCEALPLKEQPGRDSMKRNC